VEIERRQRKVKKEALKKAAAEGKVLLHGRGSVSNSRNRRERTRTVACVTLDVLY
jgi:hypothetical protein